MILKTFNRPVVLLNIPFKVGSCQITFFVSVSTACLLYLYIFNAKHIFKIITLQSSGRVVAVLLYDCRFMLYNS